MAFSLILLMPSWGSAANGLMTFNGSWHKLKTDPAAKFMVLALVFYAAATFEGSMMAIRTVNSLSHYTEWTIAHVHSGALGWVAMITIGSLYAMAPRALGQPAMHSRKRHGAALLAAHRWACCCTWSRCGPPAVTEGLMWRATQPDGSLTYGFIDSLIAIKPCTWCAGSAACCILAGMVVMAWNLWHTAADARAQLIKPIPVPIPEPVPQQVPAPLPAGG